MDKAKKQKNAELLFEKRLKAYDLGLWIGNDKVVSMLREFYTYGILDRLKLYNVRDTQLPEKYDRRRKLMSNDIAEMQKLRSDGWTLTALASKFNVSIQTCRYWCNAQARAEISACTKRWKQAHPISKSEMRQKVKSSMQYRQKLREEGKL